jgi:hypothetical protein
MNSTRTLLVLVLVTAVTVIMSAAPAVAAQNRQLDLAEVCGPFVPGDGWGPPEPATHGGFWGNIANGGDNVAGIGPSSQDRCVSVVWAGTEPDAPFVEGRGATVTLDTSQGGAARQIRMRVLDGQAVNAAGHLLDSFQVFITNVRGNSVAVYAFDPGDGTSNLPPTAVSIEGSSTLPLKTTPTSEEYRCHTIPLPITEIAPGRAVHVTIMATGSAWALFDIFGQLGVDFIELIGNGSAQLPGPLCPAPGGNDKTTIRPRGIPTFSTIR